MPTLCFAPLDVHELVELQHPALAATPALAPLVKDGCARMMHATLSFAVTSCVSLTTPSSSAGHALFECYARVVVL